MTIRDMIHWDRPTNTTKVNKEHSGYPLSLLQNAINKLFDDFFDEASETQWTKAHVFPAINIVENEKNVKVKVELPGIQPEDIDISASNGFLTIKGSKKNEEKEENESFLRHEVYYGAFQRIVALPYLADTDNANVKFNNGILMIEIPQKVETLRKAKKLQIPRAA